MTRLNIVKIFCSGWLLVAIAILAPVKAPEPYDYFGKRAEYLHKDQKTDLDTFYGLAGVIEDHTSSDPDVIFELIQNLNHDVASSTRSHIETVRMIGEKYGRFLGLGSMELLSDLLGEFVQLRDPNQGHKCSTKSVHNIMAMINVLYGLRNLVNESAGDSIERKLPNSYPKFYKFVGNELMRRATECIPLIIENRQAYMTTSGDTNRWGERKLDAILLAKPVDKFSAVGNAEQPTAEQQAQLLRLARGMEIIPYQSLRVAMGDAARKPNEDPITTASEGLVKPICNQIIGATEQFVDAYELAIAISPRIRHVLRPADANQEVVFDKLREYNRLCYTWLSHCASHSKLPDEWMDVIRDAILEQSDR